jgi:GNAT superfamily N-acetyltransferase
MQRVPFGERNIRPATVSDARRIAEVHVAAWKTTYHEIFPASVLESLSVDKREAFWKEMLLKQDDSITFVACDAADEVVGFASGGAERSGSLGHDGELHAIYLLEGMRGQGLGSLLVRRLARELQSRGFSSLAVWVLGLNPYRRFYEALGGVTIAEKTIERSGKSFVEIAYGWQDLSGLAEWGGPGVPALSGE